MQGSVGWDRHHSAGPHAGHDLAQGMRSSAEKEDTCVLMDKREFLEIYKAHLHLADRIQHKQDNANKFYGGSITALIAALILISTSEDNDLPVKLIGIGVSI